MIRLFATGIAALIVMTLPADAATVRSRSGATAQVAAQHAGKFQCLINHYDAAGAPIRFMGGIARRGFRQSKHPLGAALDINQIARNVNTPRVPAGATAWARSCGLFHGALWHRNPDAGHFEVPGRSPGRHHRRHRRAAPVASGWPF
jgi:hypothetical protein